MSEWEKIVTKIAKELRRPVLQESEKIKLIEELGDLDLNKLNELFEVNQNLINYNNYRTDELTKLIKNAIKQNNMQRVPYQIQGSMAIEVLINNKNYPKIYLVDLDDEFGEYIAQNNSILIDALNSKGYIDEVKLNEFFNNADFTISHELAHADQYDFLQSQNKTNLYYNANPAPSKDFTEIYAYKQQLTNMTKHYFVQEMKKAINLMDPTKNTSLNEIFSKAVNNIIVDIFEKHSHSKEFFKNMSKDVKNDAYKYIWSEAKQIFADRYSTYESWYEIRKTGRQI